MSNFKLVSIQLIASTISSLLLFPASTPAANLEPDFLELPTIIVRDRLISRGIAAYQSGYYSEAIHLLRNFLSPHRIITTPLEKVGINYLALAYQAVGESSLATETIERAISVTNNSPLELADSEYNAGIIAERQNQRETANLHWEKARQLYKNHNRKSKWAKTTRKLAQSYRILGSTPKYRQLLQELE